MKVLGVSIETREIEIENEEEYRAAKEDGAVGDLLDAELSNMDGGTLIMEPGGQVIDPWDVGQSLETLVEPILRLLDPWWLTKYAVQRQVEVNIDHAITYEQMKNEELEKIKARKAKGE